MECPSCGAANRSGRRFCAQCATPLILRCAACGAENAPDDRHCGACAAQLPSDQGSRWRAGTAERPLAAERKRCTILFADLVGFTGLSEREDPEVVQELVTRAFDRLSAVVVDHGGLIEKFAGDAMLAIFGVPVTHEDDAFRAVRAALRMQRAMEILASELAAAARQPLAVRIGIETGEVFVDRGRATRERDRMVTGDPVNVAARLQQAADPGAVLIGPVLWAAVGGSIEADELDPLHLKGKAEPIPAWRARRISTAPDRRMPFGHEAPLIGRDGELETLTEAVRRSATDRRANLVTVLGEAGIGKSRLARELQRHLEQTGREHLWRTGRCLAYGQSSYSALAEAIKTDLEVLDDDDAAEATAKLDARLAALSVPLADAHVNDALRAAIGLDASSRLGRDELFEGWRRYLEFLAATAPLVLVLEDLHWADEALLDFIEFIAPWADGPITIVALARQELLERRPRWAEGIDATTVDLQPLDLGESRRLADALLGDDAARLAGSSEIAANAGGNPLFVEELARSAAEQRSGVGSLVLPLIPSSIRDVLGARLDRLPPQEKRLAQDAAVIGRFFWDGALAHLAASDRAAIRHDLRGLLSKRIVVPRQPSSLSGEVEYAFRHVLIRDVAYEMVPKGERVARHVGVAAWAEQRFAERLDDAVDVIAWHYGTALEYEAFMPSAAAEQLAALRAKTLEYARRAGARAARLWELASATRWLRLAVDQARALGVSPGEQAKLMLEYLEGSEDVEPVETRLVASREALDLLDQGHAEDIGVRLRLRRIRGDAEFERGDFDRAVSTLRESLSLLEGQSPTAARAEVLARLGRMLWRTGAAAEAQSVLQRAIDEARGTGAVEAERWGMHDLAVALSELGRHREALPLAEQSLDAARQAGDRALLWRCYHNVPVFANRLGDWKRSMLLFDEGLAQARRANASGVVGGLLTNLGGTLASLGRVQEAIPMLLEAATIAERLGNNPLTGGSAFLGTAYLHAGNVEEATRCLRAAGDDVRALGQMELTVAALRAGLAWREDPELAVRELAAAVERAVADGSPNEIERAAPLLARMAYRLRDTTLAAAALRRFEQTVDDVALSAYTTAQHDWLRALTAGTDAAAADALADVAQRFHEVEYPRDEAEAWADAALGHARDGRDPASMLDRARRLYRELGCVPILGGLPEERWLTAVS